MRVLVVEDERMVVDAIVEWLRRESFAVDVAVDGAQALALLDVNEYDVVVLDRDLPVLSGDEVCRRLAATDRATRVLMLTAAADVLDRVEGLALGADDYLPKPFAAIEMVARVHALARRTRPALPPVLQRGGLHIDPARRQLFRDDRYIPVTPKEFGVMLELMRADGAAVSAEQLLERAWDEHIDPFTTVVRVIIRKLRRKLGDPPVIHTVPGTGYRIP